MIIINVCKYVKVIIKSKDLCIYCCKYLLIKSLLTSSWFKWNIQGFSVETKCETFLAWLAPIKASPTRLCRILLGVPCYIVLELYDPREAALETFDTIDVFLIIILLDTGADVGSLGVTTDLE